MGACRALHEKRQRAPAAARLARSARAYFGVCHDRDRHKGSSPGVRGAGGVFRAAPLSLSGHHRPIAPPVKPTIGTQMDPIPAQNDENPAIYRAFVHGRYWARTSDLRLVEAALSQLS